MRKCRGYWTRETSFNAAKLCKTKSEFKRRFSRAYKLSLNNEWLNDYVWFIEETEARKISKLKWVYETSYKEAQKYNTIKEYKKYSKSYTKACKMGWIKDFTWLSRCRKVNGYYSYELCEKEASKYKSVKEFCKGNNRAYEVSRINGWIYNFFDKHVSQYTYEYCRDISKSYKTKTEFKKFQPSAYDKSRLNGWLDEFSWLHDERLNISGKIDSVYVYEFHEYNVAYVGRTLTRLQLQRDKQHICNIKVDPVAKFAKDNADFNAAKNIRNRVAVTVLRESLLKQLDNGAFEPRKLKREKVKEVLLSFRRSLQNVGSECTNCSVTTFDYV